MDIKKDSATYEVPEFKVARIGGSRKRRRSGFAFLRSAAPRGAWSGVAGGTSAVGGARLTFGKAMMSIMFTSLLGIAGVQMGKVENAARSTVKPVERKIVSMPPIAIEGDTSNLPAASNDIPNSLGYVAGSVDGLTPEERAKQAAEAAAAAEAQRLADEKAKKAEEDAGKPDAAALLAAAQADGGKSGKGGPFNKKFGALSTSAGGSSALAGGAGLAGGVGRQFGSPSSLGKSFNGEIGALRGGARPSFSKVASAKAAASTKKTLARRQLDTVYLFTRRALVANQAVGTSYNGSVPYDIGADPGGTGINGGGAGGGVGTGSGGASGSPNANLNSNSGGPTGASTAGCPSGQYMDANGACQPINSGGGDNKTPYQWMYDLATGLLLLMTVLAAIALWSHGLDWLGDFGELIRMNMRMVMLVIGGIIAGLGALIFTQAHDKMAGGVLVIVGAVICYLAPTAVETAEGEAVTNMSVSQVFGTIAGGFAASMGHGGGD